MTYILFNPLANSGHGAEGLDAVRAAFASEKPTLHDLTALDAAAFFGGLTADDRVILCGGDGTIHHLINDLGGQKPAAPILVWRYGTGNDFVRDVTTDAREQTVLLNDYMDRLPTAGLGGETRRFLNGCSGGVDALVCARMNEAAGDRSGYVSTAIRCFFRDYKTTTARVTVDGETREYEDVWMAGVMNGRYQGGGMLFGPGQDRRSDRLFCYVWHGTKPLGTLLHFPAIMKGTHTKYTKYCEIRTGKEVAVEFGDPQFVQMDGETVPNITRFTVTK